MGAIVGAGKAEPMSLDMMVANFAGAITAAQNASTMPERIAALNGVKNLFNGIVTEFMAARDLAKYHRVEIPRCARRWPIEGGNPRHAHYCERPPGHEHGKDDRNHKCIACKLEMTEKSAAPEEAKPEPAAPPPRSFVPSLVP